MKLLSGDDVVISILITDLMSLMRMQFTFKVYLIQYLNGYAHYTTRTRKKKDKSVVNIFTVSAIVLIIPIIERI